MWSRRHDCRKHYELRNYQKLFICDGCNTEGSGERYLCKICGHELHKDCRFPKTSISHDYFPRRIFKFREEPYTNRGHILCEACGKQVSGFNYHCDKKRLSLHPCCVNLEKKVHINGAVFDLGSKGSSSCVWCKEKVSGWRRVLPGWWYGSKDCCFHVYCMKDMAREACRENWEMELRKGEYSRDLVKSSRSRIRTIFETIKWLLKVIWTALLGDPAVLISDVFVELVSRGLK